MSGPGSDPEVEKRFLGKMSQRHQQQQQQKPKMKKIAETTKRRFDKVLRRTDAFPNSSLM